MANQKIKILGISCAHREGMNTAWLVQFSLKAIEKFGRNMKDFAHFETQFIDLARKKIEPCPNCELCFKLNNPMEENCPVKSDYLVKELLPAMTEADGYVFGAPVYTFLYTSKFRVLFDRLAAWRVKGQFANKPAASVTAAMMGTGGGQESCLVGMNRCMRALGMFPASWAHGSCGNSGPPFGPLPREDDGKLIGIKNDKSAQYVALVNARRVGEIALMQKLAETELGELYAKEFNPAVLGINQ